MGEQAVAERRPRLQSTPGPSSPGPLTGTLALALGHAGELRGDRNGPRQPPERVDQAPLERVLARPDPSLRVPLHLFHRLAAGQGCLVPEGGVGVRRRRVEELGLFGLERAGLGKEVCVFPSADEGLGVSDAGVEREGRVCEEGGGRRGAAGAAAAATGSGAEESFAAAAAASSSLSPPAAAAACGAAAKR